MRQAVFAAMVAMLVLSGCADDGGDDMIVRLNDTQITDESAVPPSSPVSGNLDDTADDGGEDGEDDEEYADDKDNSKDDNSTSSAEGGNIGDAGSVESGAGTGEDGGTKGNSGVGAESGVTPGGEGSSADGTPSPGDDSAGNTGSCGTATLTMEQINAFCRVEGGKTVLHIPAQIDGRDVSGIAIDSSFSCNKIEADGNSKYFVVDGGVLFEKDMTKLVLYPNRGLEKYTIPNSVEVICDFAFCKTDRVSIIAGEGSCLKTIGQRAFFRSNVQNVDLEGAKSLKDICSGAFADCSNLSVSSFKVYDKSAVNAASDAFGGNTKITWDDVKSIE